MSGKNKLFGIIVISLSSIISLLLIIAILETGLIIYDKGRPLSDGDYGWSTWSSGNERHYKAWFEENFLDPWHEADADYVPHTDELNQFGFRGKPMEDSPMNIVLLGDSAVETSHPINDMPERYLASELEKKAGFMPNVISMGSWGWGTDQQYLAIKQHIDDINPSYVVLWFVSNDYRDNTYPKGNSGRKPTFWMSENKLQGPNHEFLEEFKPEKLRLTRLLKRRELLGVNLDQDRGFFKKYVEPNLMPMESIKPCSNGIDFDLSKSIKDYHSSDLSYLSVHNIKFADPRPNWLDYEKNLTRELLLKIKELAESRGSRFFIFHVNYPGQNFNLPMKTICSKEFGEVTYSLENLYKLLDDTFQGIEHYYFEIPTGSDFMDDFDGHLNDKFNKYIMKKVASLIEIDRLDGNN
jgi:hypothetical protein|tara:strand:- start:84 stop:1313 length:1230 start_codon:yes stop_codon:yes gene_type:complete